MFSTAGSVLYCPHRYLNLWYGRRPRECEYENSRSISQGCVVVLKKINVQAKVTFSHTNTALFLQTDNTLENFALFVDGST